MKRSLIVIVFFVAGFALAQDAKQNFELGKNLMVLSKWADAAKEFEKVLKKEPNNPDALFNKSLCHYFLYEYDTAMIEMNKLIKIAPNIPDVNNLYGLIKLKKQDTATAIEYFNKAIKLDSKFTEAYLNRGKVYLEKKQLDKAYADLTKALELDTLKPEIYFQLARTEHLLEKYSDALKHFTLAMEFGYTSSDVFMRRANTYFKLEDYDKAIKDYTRVIHWEPLHALAYNNRSFAFEKIGDTLHARQDKQMVADIEYSKTLNPDDVKMVKFKSSDSSFTILIPERFNSFERKYKDSIIVLFHPDSILAQNHRVAFRIKIVPFYAHIIKANEPAEVIEHWRRVQDSAGTQYYRWELFERRNKPYRTFPTILDKILYQEDYLGVASVVWNYGIAYGDHLIEMSFAFPLPFYFYYNQIFEKTIASLSIDRIM